MEYFWLLNLNREPFSNATDPDFFFKSRQHLDCLQQLELSIRNRRGMNVVIGDVGTGKTTLCHQLIRQFKDEHNIENHLILNPDFQSIREFLITVVRLIAGKKPPSRTSERVLKEFIKQYLFQKVLVKKKTVVLIIDEGQKLPAPCLEILREFLNFEKGEYKLLQLVIFAQKEFEQNLKKYINFTDRINLYFELNPLGFKETRKMIRFRLDQSKKTTHGRETSKDPGLFTLMGQLAIYLESKGYPRKIVNLCHHSLIKIIVKNRPKAGWFTVRSCLKQAVAKNSMRMKGFEISVAAAGLLAAALLAEPVNNQIQIWRPQVLKAATADIPHQIFKWLHGKPETDKRTRQNRGKVYKVEPEDVLPPNAQSQTVVEAASPLPSDATPYQPLGKDSRVRLKALKISSETNETHKSAPKKAVIKGPPLATDDTIRVPVTMIGDRDSSEAENPSGFEEAFIGLEESSEVVAEKTPPIYLGRLEVQPDEIISWMVVKTYGLFKEELLDIVIRANPHIDDPDHVEGRVIAFPAIPSYIDHMQPNHYWIQLDMRDSLQDAFEVLRAYPKSYPNHAPNIGLIPHWNNQHGLKFSVIFKNCFLDEESARNRMKTLPYVPSSRWKIVSSWPRGNIYFADPYSCKNLAEHTLNKG